MDFGKINEITQAQANIRVYGHGELDWGTAYNGWTDSKGRLCSSSGKLFEGHKLSVSEMSASDSEIAQLCIQTFQNFKNVEYTPNAITITFKPTGEASICVFAYSKTFLIMTAPKAKFWPS